MKNKIGLFYVELGQEGLRDLAHECIKQAKRVIPDVHIMQFTNKREREALPLIDECRRLDLNGMGLMEARIHFYSKCNEEILLIDPDVWIQSDPFQVFDKTVYGDFDVALTKRAESDRLIVKDDGQHAQLLEKGNAAPQMPYNTGVIFSRNPEFWSHVLMMMRTMTIHDRNWFGDQVAVKQVAQSGRFDVLDLPCSQYNYSPAAKAEDVSDKIMVHYKGKRKEWMLNRAKRELIDV